MAEKNYGDNSQLSEIIKYISDTIKFPVLGNGGGFAPIGTINSWNNKLIYGNSSTDRIPCM